MEKAAEFFKNYEVIAEHQSNMLEIAKNRNELKNFSNEQLFGIMSAQNSMIVDLTKLINQLLYNKVK